jgi:hypothetical protein
VKEHYERAVENFVRSCAGYCVASYVLGIGDRHNGNIMVTQGGHLFHIDFGHFLGNFKSKFGINRERAKFVFTLEMAYVMGGKNFRNHALFGNFKDLCSKAFLTLRKHATLLENLFVLMVSAGMPELMVRGDITYLRDRLLLDMTDSEADTELQKEIQVGSFTLAPTNHDFLAVDITKHSHYIPFFSFLLYFARLRWETRTAASTTTSTICATVVSWIDNCSQRHGFRRKCSHCIRN